MSSPTGGNIISTMAKQQIRDGSMFNKGEHMDGLQKILSSYGKVVDDAFENQYMKAALLWFAAQSGPLPDQSATGDFAGWQSMLHESGAKHPRGGSGMLTQAMKNLIEAYDGKVKANSPVSKIIIEHGKAIGVRTESGEEYLAPLIISKCSCSNNHVKISR